MIHYWSLSHIPYPNKLKQFPSHDNQLIQLRDKQGNPQELKNSMGWCCDVIREKTSQCRINQVTWNQAVYCQNILTLYYSVMKFFFCPISITKQTLWLSLVKVKKMKWVPKIFEIFNPRGVKQLSSWANSKLICWTFIRIMNSNASKAFLKEEFNKKMYTVFTDILSGSMLAGVVT